MRVALIWPRKQIAVVQKFNNYSLKGSSSVLLSTQCTGLTESDLKLMSGFSHLFTVPCGSTAGHQLQKPAAPFLSFPF